MYLFAVVETDRLSSTAVKRLKYSKINSKKVAECVTFAT